MNRLLIVFIAAVIVSGCATRPTSNSESKPVSSNRIIDDRYLNSVPNAGIVTIKRDSGFMGSACTSRVFVNAKPMVDLNSAEKIVLYLPADKYILSVWPNGICGGGMSETTVSVKAEAELSFRIGYGSNGDFTINPTAF